MRLCARFLKMRASKVASASSTPSFACKPARAFACKPARAFACKPARAFACKPAWAFACKPARAFACQPARRLLCQPAKFARAGRPCIKNLSVYTPENILIGLHHQAEVHKQCCPRQHRHTLSRIRIAKGRFSQGKFLFDAIRTTTRCRCLLLQSK